MTHQEKKALLKRIFALPTEWADSGGSYGKGGPVGSDDAAMLWPEDVIDAINQFAEDSNVARSPWVKTSDRLPDDNEPVLVTYVGYVDNLPYNDSIAVYAHEITDNYAGAWYWKDSDGVDDNPVRVSITHWMPIPPLPEEQHLRALHGNVFNAKNQFFGNVENLFDS